MKNKFTKYNSIENAYRQKYIDMIVEAGYANDKWTVSEKCHGANFQFMYDGEKLEVAKRSTIIGEGGSFYNHRILLDKYGDKVKELYNYFCKTNESITIYGEICGQGVQRGVWYKDEQDFYGFDIIVKSDESELTLSVDFKNNLFKRFGIPHAQTLFTGNLEECLKYPNEFDSLIPAILGEENKVGNICEGVVISPLVPKFFNNGSRILIKNKNSKFSEQGRAPKMPKKAYTFSEKGEFLLGELLVNITENRLRNVLSHVGEVNNTQFGMVLGMLIKDAIQDFLKDNMEAFKALSKVEQAQITKRTKKYASELIRPNFANIIDMVF